MDLRSIVGYVTMNEIYSYQEVKRTYLVKELVVTSKI
jgi:hypothetical protein